MKNYLIDLRYSEELEFVGESGPKGKTLVILKDADGSLYRWCTCQSSKPYQYLKANNKAKVLFTYRSEVFGQHEISHLTVAQ